MADSRETKTFGEMLEILRGKDPKQAREDALFSERIHNQSLKYKNTSPSSWPDIDFQWDINSASQRYAMDGLTEEEFNSRYPAGFLLGEVDLVQIDRLLSKYCYRSPEELWEVGSGSKLAKMIVYLSEGHPISPPLIKVIDGDKLFFEGGNHRFAVAKAANEERIPIYVQPKYKSKISELVKVNWMTK